MFLTRLDFKLKTLNTHSTSLTTAHHFILTWKFWIQPLEVEIGRKYFHLKWYNNNISNEIPQIKFEKSKIFINFTITLTLNDIIKYKSELVKS